MTTGVSTEDCIESFYFQTMWGGDNDTKISPTDQKTQEVFLHIQPLAGGSVEVGVKATWGGGKGEASGYIQGEAHDDNGNYVKGEVEQKSDGTGSATVSGGHKEEK